MRDAITEALLAAAALADDQATTGAAIEAILRYLGCYEPAYDFLYVNLRAAGVVLADQESPAQVADSIRWAVLEAAA